MTHETYTTAARIKTEITAAGKMKEMLESDSLVSASARKVLPAEIIEAGVKVMKDMVSAMEIKLREEFDDL
jgi:hypothetical protein